VYIRRHKVRKDGKEYVYLRLVEAYRTEAGGVRHRVLANLGREDALKASGQLDQLAASFTRLDPPPLGARREVGALLLVHHYLQRLGLIKLIDAAVPMRGRAYLSHGEVIAVLVANRLTAPSPLYDVAGWASSAAVAELLGVPGMLLNDDRLGRALEALAPVAEAVRGQLALAAASRCAVDLSRLHVDLTAVRVTGAYEDSSLIAKGWAADRSIARQIKTLQASTPEGVAMYYRPHKGSCNELPCFAAALERLAALAPPGVVVVADSALGYLANLAAADTAGLRFVVPLRADTGWATRFIAEVGALDQLAELDHCSQREQRRCKAERTRWRGLLRPFPIEEETTGHHDLRVAYIWSSEEAASIADGRQRALAKAEAELTRVKNGLGGRYYKTQKQVDTKAAKIIGSNIEHLITVKTGPARGGKPTLSWWRNTEAITAASRLDGLYALATNLPDHGEGRPVTAVDVLRIYKDQWIVEQRHRDLKQTLKVRPIFLHNDDRIEALIAIIGIALLIFGLIEADLRHHLGDGVLLPGLLPEQRAAKPTGRAVLAAFDGLCATYTISGLVLDRLTPTQRMILAHLDIPLPWPERPT
jgi:transposase